ncbi:dolichyl-phosphate-mannose--protein mannosyltransferase [Plantactinospora sp. GCM10030261]|uniref:dolichyl-phosphate-mannose--protein mannosyltransferase n=1 Tax=Plantactinospora sp. GCM10030261 TaxID=3273420 RepID=UPI00361E6FB0
MTSASTAQTSSPDPAGKSGPAGDRTGHATGGIPDVVRRRLAPLDARLDRRSWLATAVVVAIAAVLRLVNLSHPPGKMFDEIYYARDAWGLLNHGAEWNYETNNPSYVVHPPLGKWLIALGQWAFGYADGEQNISVPGHLTTTAPEFGWRISAAVIGILSVLLVVRIARRMFGSTVLGCAAGLLMALDGFHLVLSRAALLDIFLLFFVLAAFGALVLDRDVRRRRWLRAMEDGYDPVRSGRLPGGVPWWRLAAAVLLGCAVSVKWSALYLVLAFLVLAVLWDVGARRSAGVARPWRTALLDEFGWLVVCGFLIVGTYLASWSGWFLTDDGYFRHYLADSGRSEPPVIGALRNLWHYHVEAYGFHTTLAKEHKYQSWPWQWLLLGRPVAFYWSGNGSCGAASCASEVLLLGTPVLWWSFLPALVAVAWLGIARRDWRAGSILLVVGAGLLPWFWYALDNRTMFFFYAAPAQPFLVLAVVYVLGAIMSPASGPATVGTGGAASADQPAAGTPAQGTTAQGTTVDGTTVDGTPMQGTTVDGTPARGTTVDGTTASAGAGDDAGRPGQTSSPIGALVAGGYVLIVAVCFAYFYPIYVGDVITYAEWSARMWLGGRWI